MGDITRYSVDLKKLRKEVLLVTPSVLSRLLNIPPYTLNRIEDRQSIIYYPDGLGCLISRLVIISAELSKFMNPDEIVQWLEKPNSRLNGKQPIKCMQNMKDNREYCRTENLVRSVSEDTSKLLNELKIKANWIKSQARSDVS